SLPLEPLEDERGLGPYAVGRGTEGRDLVLVEPNRDRRHALPVHPGRDADADPSDVMDLGAEVGGYREDPVLVAEDRPNEGCDRLARAVDRRTLVPDDRLATCPDTLEHARRWQVL